ncbi:MAG: FAD-dependent oxidoreductase [bacterium]
MIAGGGIAGLEAALALHDLAPDLATVELVAPDPDFTYKPMVVEEPFSLAPPQQLELEPLLRDLGMGFVSAALTAVDPDQHMVDLSDGRRLPFDLLIVAVGGRTRPAYTNVETFWAGRSNLPIDELLDRAAAHPSRTLAFIVPPGCTWPLPLYELALMSRRRAEEQAIYGLRIQVVTPERSPLIVFGSVPSQAIATLLRGRGIDVLTDSYAVQEDDGRMRLTPADAVLEAAAIVALPVIEGPGVPGLPADEHGFIPIDEHARVSGVDGVYAAGDGTTFPIKQGGLATQQADAAAEQIASQLGAAVEPRGFRPVLRGQLLTGDESLNLRQEITGGQGEGTASLDYLWWPPHKVSGRYLAAWLAHTSPREDLEPPSRPIEVEIALARDWHEHPATAGGHSHSTD